MSAGEDVFRGRIYDATAEVSDAERRMLAEYRAAHPEPMGPVGPMVRGCVCGVCFCGPVTAERCAAVLRWTAGVGR